MTKRKLANLPASLKRALEKSRGAGLVMFNENDPAYNPERELVIAAVDKNKLFNICLAENPMDVYRSPHLLNLKNANNPLRETAYKPSPEFGYNKLPGGAFMQKYHVLDFWDMEQSEIIVWLKAQSAQMKMLFRKFFYRAELTTKLPGESGSIRRSGSGIEQISIFNLLLFFANFYYKIYLFFYKIICLAYLMVKKSVSKDEVVWLPKKSQTSSPEWTALVDRIVAASSAPTIAELIRPQANSTPVSTDKFKYVAQNPNRRREVQEKYLEGNFTRKGVVVTTQLPTKPWPKDSFSWDIGQFAFSTATLKPVAVFCGILIALVASVKVLSYYDDVINVKGKVMGEAENALSNINDATAGLKSMDFDLAREKFSTANAGFVSAKNQLNDIKSFITTLAEIAPAENTFKSGTNIIDLGEHLSSAAGHLLSGIGDVDGNADLSLASRIKNLSVELIPAISELEAANINAGKIGLNNLPPEDADKFVKLRNSLSAAIASIKRLAETSDFTLKVLGENDVRRYLVVFQNDNELRATGGFMGSFALVDLRDGKIDKITVPPGGTYEVLDQFNELVAPPDALRLVANKFQFQDSNWWPDFPTSAKNIKWFYEKSGGPTVDGVIAINSSFFGTLLKNTGPIKLPKYGKTITAENFEYELQKSIELEAKDKSKPKKIISELMPIMLDKLLNTEPKEFFNLAESFDTGLKNRNIQMYFLADDLQKFALERNWAGEMSAPAGSDYLSVIAANVNGGKTDSNIRQKIYHNAEIQSDGTVLDKVLIERRNIGPTDDYFTKSNNVSYVRVYVPLGSELVSAVGFKGYGEDKFKSVDPKLETPDNLLAENGAITDPVSGTKIYNENGQTVFANWTVTGPGKTKETLLVYKLPFKVVIKSESKNIVSMAADLFSKPSAAYSLKFQKQAGRDNDEFSTNLSYADNLKLKLSYPDNIEVSSGSLNYSATTTNDTYLVAGFIRK